MKRYTLSEDVVFGLLLGGIILSVYLYYWLWKGLAWAWHWVQINL